MKTTKKMATMNAYGVKRDQMRKLSGGDPCLECQCYSCRVRRGEIVIPPDEEVPLYNTSCS